MFSVKLHLVLVLALITISVAELDQPSTEKTAERQRHTDLYGDPLPTGALMRLGTVRMRHVAVPTIAFAADGKSVLSYSRRDPTTIRQWDAISGRELRHIRLQGAEKVKRGAQCDWDGKTVVVLHGEQLILWDASTGQERRRIEIGNNKVDSPTLSPSGHILAAVHSADKGCAVRLWDAASGKELRSLDVPQPVTGLTFSPDGKLLGVGESWSNLHLWEVSTGKRLRTIPGAGVEAIAFSLDGSKVSAVCRVNGVYDLKIWSVSDGLGIAAMPKVEGAVYFSVRFSSDSRLLLVGGLCQMFVFDIADRKLLHRKSTGAWGKFALSPDGKTLATVGFVGIHLWDTATWQEISPRPSHDSSVWGLTPTPDGRRMVSLSSADDIVYLWDAASGKSIAALQAGEGRYHMPMCGVLSADGKRFAAGREDGKVRVWDLDKVREARQMRSDLRNAQGVLNPQIFALSFMAGANRLAAVSGAYHTMGGSRPKFQLDIWDLDTGKSVARRALPLRPKMMWRVAFTADGHSVAFRSDDRLIVQDVATGREWVSVSGDLREPFAWSPDGQILAATFYESKAGAPIPVDPGPEIPRTIVLTEFVSGKTLCRIETGQSGLQQLAYSPDGRTLAGTTADGFRIWDAATGKELLRRLLHSEVRYPFARSLTFLPDAGRLATGLEDGTTLIWDLEPKPWRGEISIKKIDNRSLERLWEDLGGEDAAKAHRALWTLAAAATQSVPFLKERLRPASPLDGEQVRRWIADLDSDEFPVRDAAARKLTSFGEQAEPMLRQALEGKPSLEARKRLEALHGDADAAGRGIVRSTELLRTLRAIRVLERIGDREARQVLQRIASGDAAARSTQQAKQALQRLERRGGESVNIPD